MLNAGFNTEWLKLADKDPYSALGVSLMAEDRRISKRYHQIAKQLHPDQLENKDDHEIQFASQVISRLINPAYQRLKQENTRKEALSTMRFKVRRMAKADQLHPTFESAQQLLRVPDPEVDTFYEQTLSQLAAIQFQSPDNFHQTLQQIGQLNLVFLRRKMGNVIREKRTGLVAAPKSIPKPSNLDATLRTASEPPVINYAEKYRTRALSFIQQKNYAKAREQLQEALKIEPDNAEFHSMLGQVYYMDNMQGMARVHFKKALTLKPDHLTAQKYVTILEKARTSLNGTQATSLKNNSKSNSQNTFKTASKPHLSATQSPKQSQGWLGKLLTRLFGA